MSEVYAVFDGATSMKPEHFSSPIPFYPSFPFVRQVCLLGGLGVLGSLATLAALPAWAQTEVDIEAPIPVEAAPPIAPAETSAESLLRPQVTATPTPEPIAPGPQVVFEQAAPVAPPASTAPTSEPAPYTNVFIDPTDYSLGATPSDSPSLVFSDRSTGCQFTLQQGQSTPSRTCGATAQGNGQSAGSNGQVAGNAYGDAPVAAGNGFSIGPVTVGGNGLTVGGTTVISREYFNERLQTLNLLRRGAEEFVFPLAIPAPITSLFGWRQHPIFGDRRFHAGTDLGAPEGTPVVATKDGEVYVADYLGGYGLTVILRHDDGTLETRYAHLSQILVRPGETIKQGEVVGLVGSTGNSTGPHLHFELRELTAQGWVLHNPNELLGYAVANLADALNNPLLALGLTKEASEKDEAKLNEQSLELPYRPAQPNAN